MWCLSPSGPSCHQLPSSTSTILKTFIRFLLAIFFFDLAVPPFKIIVHPGKFMGLVSSLILPLSLWRQTPWLQLPLLGQVGGYGCLSLRSVYHSHQWWLSQILAPLVALTITSSLIQGIVLTSRKQASCSQFES